MREISTVLDIICSVLESVWLYYIIDLVFERRSYRFYDKKSPLLVFCIICSAGAVIGMNNIVLSSPYTTLVWMIMGICFSCIFWKGDILSASAVIGTYALLLLFYSLIILSVINLIGGEELVYATTGVHGITRFYFLIIVQGGWSIINFGIIKWIKRKIIFKSNASYYLYITIIGLIGSTYFSIQMLTNFSIKVHFLWYVFLFAIIVLIYTLYYQAKIKSFNKEMEVINKYNNMLEKNYEKVSDFYRENAKLYHDMNHHFNALYSMLENGEQDSAKTYIEQIIEPIRISKVPNRSGIEMLDVVLHEMEKRAEQKNINITFSVQILPENIEIDKKDLCILFVNLLDNAIEAAVERVSINIRQVNKMMLVKTVNDYKVKPVKESGGFITTKKDKVKHGWGTRIIEQIVYKYEGSIEYKVDEKYVYSEIVVNDIL